MGCPIPRIQTNPDCSVYMVNHGSLFCSNIIFVLIDLSQLRHVCHLCHLRFRHLSHLRHSYHLQTLCDVVERPVRFFFSDKMTSFELVDMYFVVLIFFLNVLSNLVIFG